MIKTAITIGGMVVLLAFLIVFIARSKIDLCEFMMNEVHEPHFWCMTCSVIFEACGTHLL